PLRRPDLGGYGRQRRDRQGCRRCARHDSERYCLAQTRRRNQDRHFQFHTLWAATRPGAQRFELNYTARISLDQTLMQIDDQVANLSPSMAATVEIKTGSRTILSYLLSLLLRYRQETLHER